MEKEDKPLVSIIMATFNEPVPFIKEAIGSMINQTYANLEILIADDSTDPKTIEIIDDFAIQDKRVKILRKKERMGFVPALNYALINAHGELCARMDGDDISCPYRIERQVEYAINHPNIMIFGGWMKIIDEKGTIISERKYPISFSKIKRMFIFRSPFAHPTIMFRREVIDSGIKYNTNYKRAEDIDFYYNIFKKGFEFGNMPEFLLKYRTVGDLQIKRPHSQWVWNYRARLNNFIWHKPIFSSLALLFAFAYLLAPSKLVSIIYKRENSKNLK